jgi:hypothetical protein
MQALSSKADWLSSKKLSGFYFQAHFPVATCFGLPRFFACLA